MSARMDFEDALYELEQTTATLGFIQTAFAEGDSLIEAGESSAAIYIYVIYKTEQYSKKA